MTGRRVYLAGPMTGLPDLNRDAFHTAAQRLRVAGYDVINPHDLAPHHHDGACPPSYAVSNGHSAACYLRPCFAALLTCDHIHLLPGWNRSIGATREHDIASWAGIPVLAHTEVPA